MNHVLVNSDARFPNSSIRREYLGWLCAQRTGVTAETELYEHYVMTDAPNRHLH